MFFIDDTYIKDKGKRIYNYLGFPAALPQEIFVYFNKMQATDNNQ